MSDILTAIRHQLAVSLEGHSWPATVEVFRGWVEQERFVVPSFSVVAGRPQREPVCPQALRKEELDADTWRVFWRVQKVEVDVTLAGYFESKTQRKDFATEMGKFLTPGSPDGQSAPSRGPLELTLDEHHDEPCYVYWEDDEQDDREAQGSGHFRLDYNLTCQSGLVRPNDHLKTDYSHTLTLLEPSS